jgi:hypothetical protein
MGLAKQVLARAPQRKGETDPGAWAAMEIQGQFAMLQERQAVWSSSP